ncbi:hypothetical protein SNEBB_004902 [Seison nebaliae]|nr:hypothetical protein SNEBB_004902 [Seison nebaliae]
MNLKGNLHDWQHQIYIFLEKPIGWKCFIYHLTVFLAVLGCFILSVLSTVEKYVIITANYLFFAELFIAFFFTIEFAIRIWSVGSQSKYRKWKGRLQFLKKPICILDIFIVSASIIVLISNNSRIFAASAIRGIRFLQILRMLHVDRQGNTWQLLASVVYAHRQELIASIYIGFLIMVTTSYFVYMAEKDIIIKDRFSGENYRPFQSYADALWWGVVTMSTIGYGDKVPQTWTGRIFCSCFAVFAISFFTLPADILGSGFALKVQQKLRQKQYGRQIPTAVLLIQASWRFYAVTSTKISNDDESLEKKTPVFDPKYVGTWRTFTSSEKIPSKEISRNNRRLSNILLLTEQQRMAIRVILRIKYFVARRRFSMSRKPYEMSDVIDQYSIGQIDSMSRLRTLSRRLTDFVGKLEISNLMSNDTNKLIKWETAVEEKLKETDELLKEIEQNGFLSTTQLWQNSNKQDNHTDDNNCLTTIYCKSKLQRHSILSQKSSKSIMSRIAYAEKYLNEIDKKVDYTLEKIKDINWSAIIHENDETDEDFE